MDAISYSRSHKFGPNDEAGLQRSFACHNTRKKGAPVVLISLEDYQVLEETTYLLSSPVNARWLLESIAELEVGKGDTR